MTQSERELISETVIELLKDDGVVRVLETLATKYEETKARLQQENKETEERKRSKKKEDKEIREDNNIYNNNNSNTVLSSSTSSLVLSSSSSYCEKESVGFSASDMKDLWNAFARKYNLKEIRALTAQRRKKFALRKEEFKKYGSYEALFWKKLLYVISTRDWYFGNNNLGWKANFDWLIRSEDVIIRLMEITETVERYEVCK